MRKDGYTDIDRVGSVVGNVLDSLQGEVNRLGKVDKIYANDLLVMIEQARWMKKKLVTTMKRGDDKTMNLTRFFKPLCECIQMCYNELSMLLSGVESDSMQEVRRGVGEAIKILRKELSKESSDENC